MPHVKTLRPALVLAIASLAGPLAGQMTSDDLVRNSPFIPPAGAGVAGRTQSGPATPQQYEFRGAYSLDGVYYVNVVDRSTGKGYWGRVGEEANGIRPTRYDAVARILTAVINGQNVDLEMPQPMNSGGQVASAVNSNRPAVRPPPTLAQAPRNAPPAPRTAQAVRRVNRIPPPPPATVQGPGNYGGPRAPGVVRSQDTSSGPGVSNNNGVITPSTQNGGNTGGNTFTPPPPPVTNKPEEGPFLPNPGQAPKDPPPIPPELEEMIRNRIPPTGRPQ